jgi:hypothetical protein
MVYPYWLALKYIYAGQHISEKNSFIAKTNNMYTDESLVYMHGVVYGHLF